MVALWLVKDHSVNVEIGFIVTGTNKNVHSVTSSNTAFLSSKSNELMILCLL